MSGFWNVHVHASGRYTIRLRRWPASADLPINAPLAPGPPVPGTKAFRTTPGVTISPVKASISIGDVKAEKNIDAGNREIVFDVVLKKGRTRFTALFTTETGEEYGAYYAYVEKE